MMSMTNIFIGVMGHAYDDHKAKVVQLFVSTRAHRGLRHALLMEQCPCCRRRQGNHKDYLWFCDQDYEWLEEADNALHGITHHLSQQLDTHAKQMERHLRKIRRAFLRSSNPNLYEPVH